MKLICDCGHSSDYKVKNSFTDIDGNGKIIIWKEGEFEGFFSNIGSEHHGISEITCGKCNKTIQLY